MSFSWGPIYIQGTSLAGRVGQAGRAGQASILRFLMTPGHMTLTLGSRKKSINVAILLRLSVSTTVVPGKITTRFLDKVMGIISDNGFQYAGVHGIFIHDIQKAPNSKSEKCVHVALEVARLEDGFLELLH